MEYNKIQDKLQNLISFYSNSLDNSIKWDEYRKLERVYKSNAILKELEDRAGYLHNKMHNIGKQVYLSKKSFNHTLVEAFEKLDYVNQNQFDATNVVILTQEMFDKLCYEYIEYQVSRFIEELTDRSITSNSTCKISNLVFEWNLECKQELLKIFKSVIE